MPPHTHLRQNCAIAGDKPRQSAHSIWHRIENGTTMCRARTVRFAIKSFITIRRCTLHGSWEAPLERMDCRTSGKDLRTVDGSRLQRNQCERLMAGPHTLHIYTAVYWQAATAKYSKMAQLLWRLNAMRVEWAMIVCVAISSGSESWKMADVCARHSLPRFSY